MKKSGCSKLAIGIESSSNHILAKYNRKNDLNKIKKVFEICDQLNIISHAYLMIFPEDNKKTINKTLDFIKKLKCDFISINFYVPRVGSLKREALINNKLLNKGDYHNQDCSINTEFSNNFKRKDLIKLRNNVYINFYFRINQIYRIFKKKSILLNNFLIFQLTQ